MDFRQECIAYESFGNIWYDFIIMKQKERKDRKWQRLLNLEKKQENLY